MVWEQFRSNFGWVLEDECFGVYVSQEEQLRNWTILQKILVSVKFLSAILGPEMAAPIWTPVKNAFFLQEKPHVHKIPRFRGGDFGFWGGGSSDFIFMGAAIFLNTIRPQIQVHECKNPLQNSNPRNSELLLLERLEQIHAQTAAERNQDHRQR